MSVQFKNNSGVIEARDVTGTVLVNIRGADPGGIHDYVTKGYADGYYGAINESAGGDLSGTYPNPTVVKLHGASVPAAGALTTGNILQVNGSSSLTYGAINLAGGVNFVTGILPTSNQASQTVGGDLSGTTAAATVIKLQNNAVSSNMPTNGQALIWSSDNSDWEPTSPGGDLSGNFATTTVSKIDGASVPAAGALTTGNVLQVNGVSSLTYSAVNLAGGTNFVTGALPTANQVAQSITLTGNVTSSGGTTTSASTTVVSISGSSPIAITPANLQFTTATVSPLLSQADDTGSGATGDDLTIQAQNATGTTALGGNLILTSGTGTSADGYTSIKTGGHARLTANASGVITIANLGTGVVHSDSSGNLTSSTIVNTDVSASAAIAVSKLAAGTSAQILLNNATPTPTWTTVSGDITIGNTGSVTVTALQGHAVLSQALGATQDGYVLTWVNADNDWEASPTKSGGASTGLVANRPSSTGSGKVYFCDDLPLVYVDDPSAFAWKQYAIGGYVPKPDLAANWTAVGPLILQQTGDSILALATSSLNIAAGLKSIGGAVAPWKVTVAGLLLASPSSPGGTYTFGAVVSNGTTSGVSNIWGIYKYVLGTGGNAVAGTSFLTTGGTLGTQTRGTVAAIGSDLTDQQFPYRMRLVNDGTNLIGQVSVGNAFWRTYKNGVNTPIVLPAGLTNYGFYVGNELSSTLNYAAGALIEMAQLDTMSNIGITNITYVPGTGVVTVTTSSPLANIGLLTGHEVSLTTIVNTGAQNLNGQWVPVTVTGGSIFTFLGNASSSFTYTSGGKVLNISI
jgi:hypothetical protein